jgi:hypothetical protein
MLDMWRLPDGGGAPPVDHHDSVFLVERHCVGPVRHFIKLQTQGEGPRGDEASHHVTVLELVPDRVCMVWSGMLEKPLEVVHRRPHQTLFTAHSHRDVSPTGATHLLVIAVITVSHGHGPLKACLQRVVGGDVK